MAEASPEFILSNEQPGLSLYLVAASEQEPVLFSIDVKSFVARALSDVRKFAAFASTAITIGDLLTQIVQHNALNSSA